MNNEARAIALGVSVSLLTHDRALLPTAFVSPGAVVGRKWRDCVSRIFTTESGCAPTRPITPPPLPCLSIHLGRTRTTTSDDDEHVLLIGRPVTALKRLAGRSWIDKGPIFRRIDQWGNVDRLALTPQSVNPILKRRCQRSQTGAVFGA